MCFGLKIERQVFGILLLYNSLIFGKNLMIEVQCGLKGSIFIKVTADGNKQSCLPCRYRRSSVQDVELTVREENCEFRGKRQESLEAPTPQKPWRIQMFEFFRVVADRTHVI